MRVSRRRRATARLAVQEMHGRNFHGRDITVNVARPRGPDPKRDGTFHTDERYSGMYDAGGRLRPEFRGMGGQPPGAQGRAQDPRYDRDDRSDRERERDYQRDAHTHGASLDGSGRYGDRDPRPRQAYYE